jgi:hypothetical protein
MESPQVEGRRQRDPLLIHFLPDRRDPVAVAEVAYALGCDYEHADERGVAYFVSPSMSVDALQVLEKVLPEVVIRTPPADCRWFHYDVPTMQLDPGEAIRCDAEDVVIGDASVGRIAAGLLAPCPPGVPLLVPGERVSAWHVRRLRGRSARLVR